MRIFKDGERQAENWANNLRDQLLDFNPDYGPFLSPYPDSSEAVIRFSKINETAGFFITFNIRYEDEEYYIDALIEGAFVLNVPDYVLKFYELECHSAEHKSVEGEEAEFLLFYNRHAPHEDVLFMHGNDGFTRLVPDMVKKIAAMNSTAIS